MVLNGVSRTRPSALRPSDQPLPRTSRHAQRGDQVVFGGDNNKPTAKKPLTFQDKLKLGFDALKKELQDPKSRNYLISGYVTTAVTPVLLVASALVPVAAPALWPLAGLTALWSAVTLWESFNIMRAQKDQKAPAK